MQICAPDYGSLRFQIFTDYGSALEFCPDYGSDVGFSTRIMDQMLVFLPALWVKTLIFSPAVFIRKFCPIMGLTQSLLKRRPGQPKIGKIKRRLKNQIGIENK